MRTTSFGRRRSLNFEAGSAAAFDSHSGFYLFAKDDHFNTTSDRWKRNSLFKELVHDDIAETHESMHWLQFSTTGFGQFINRLRYYRDFFILAQVKSLANVGVDHLRQRLFHENLEPLFDYDSIEAEIIDPEKSNDSHIHKAVLLDMLERAFLEKGQYGDKLRNSDRIVWSLILMTKLDNRGLNLDLKDIEDEFSGRYVASSQFWRRPFLYSEHRGEDFFATEQLLEAHAILFESIYLRHFGHPDVAQSRGEMLQETHYSDAVVYAFRELFKDHDDDEFAAVFASIHPDDFYASLIICIDIALDIYFPKELDSLNFSEMDWYPPSRYSAAIEALKTVGFFSSENTKSKRDAYDYWAAVVSKSGLRTSLDGEPAFLRHFKDFDNLSASSALPLQGFGPFSQNITNQAVIDGIQEFYYQKKAQGFCVFIDPILNLSNDFAPTFYVLYDGGDDRVAALSKSPVINYENGTFGIADRARLIAHQLLESSLTTYPIFSAAFDDGPVQFSPGNIAETINFSGKSVPTFAFEQIMARPPMNLTF